MNIKCYSQLYHYISQVSTTERWLSSFIYDSGGILSSQSSFNMTPSPDKSYDSKFLQYTVDYAITARRSQAKRRIACLASRFTRLELFRRYLTDIY